MQNKLLQQARAIATERTLDLVPPVPARTLGHDLITPYTIDS